MDKRPHRWPAAIAAALMLSLAAAGCSSTPSNPAKTAPGASPAPANAAPPAPATAKGATAATPVTFQAPDGGAIQALLYQPSGSSRGGVVLAHGAAFNKESWADLAPQIAARGFTALALDFRGYGASKPGSAGPQAREQDVLGAIHYLKSKGEKRIALIGGSMGGGAVLDAAASGQAGEIGLIIGLSPANPRQPQNVKAGRIVVAYGEKEPGAAAIKRNMEALPGNKEIKALPTDSHAQNIFKTDQDPALTKLILDALDAWGK